MMGKREDLEQEHIRAAARNLDAEYVREVREQLEGLDDLELKRVVWWFLTQDGPPMQYGLLATTLGVRILMNRRDAKKAKAAKKAKKAKQ